MTRQASLYRDCYRGFKPVGPKILCKIFKSLHHILQATHPLSRKWILVVTGFIKHEVIMYHEIMHKATKCEQILQMPVPCHLAGCPESSSHAKNVQEVKVISNHRSSSRSTAWGTVWSTDWWKPGWHQDQRSQGWAGIGRSCHQGNKDCVSTDGFCDPGKMNHCGF